MRFFRVTALAANTLGALKVLPNTRANPTYMDNRFHSGYFRKKPPHTLESLTIYIFVP